MRPGCAVVGSGAAIGAGADGLMAEGCVVEKMSVTAVDWPGPPFIRAGSAGKVSGVVASGATESTGAVA